MSNSITKNQLESIFADQNVGMSIQEDEALDVATYWCDESGELCSIVITNLDAEIDLDKSVAEDYNTTLEEIYAAIKSFAYATVQ